MRRALLLIMLVLIFGCAQRPVVQKQFDQSQIRPLSELKTANNLEDTTNLVGYLDQGDSIPLKLGIESQWLGLRQDHVDLVTKQRIYLRLALPEDMTQDRLKKILNLDTEKLSALSETEQASLFKGVMLFLSPDAVNWAPLNNPTALKEVFDIKAGTLSAGMGMNETEGAWIALTVKELDKN